MAVPGGTEVVSRLIGNVETDPERFASSLNRILLRAIRTDHDWQAVDARVELMTFLETVAELESRLSFPVKLDGLSSESLDHLDALGTVLGFVLDRESSPVRVEALEGEDYVLPSFHNTANSKGTNLLLAAMGRCRVNRWPRLWHSMRSTRH